MMEAAILAVIGYIALIAIIVRCLRANGDDTDAQQAADSVRQTLDADSRFDEVRTYTQRPHMRGNTAYGREVK